MTVKMIKLLRGLGGLLAIFGVFFVGLQLWEYGPRLQFSNSEGKVWWTLIGGVLTYALVSIALALAWMCILRHLGEKIAPIAAIGIYGTTQLAKYIPGNILHLAGRQALGLSKGLSGWALAKSSAYELGLIFIAGALFSILALPGIAMGISSAVAIVIFATCLLGLASVSKAVFSDWFLKALCWQMVFLFFASLTFVALFEVVANSPSFAYSNVTALSGAFVLAWTAGLATPGAPAGAGIRELVLIACLDGLATEADLLVTIVLSRVLSIMGDLLYFLLSGIVLQKVR